MPARKSSNGEKRDLIFIYLTLDRRNVLAFYAKCADITRQLHRKGGSFLLLNKAYSKIVKETSQHVCVKQESRLCKVKCDLS
jgi:hypothetical protein